MNKYAALIFLLGEAQAWSATGHLLVARIAQDILAKESPETIKEVENILSVLKKSKPTQTAKEGDHPLVECTTFADDIKYAGGGFQSPWHFVDQPYYDQGGSPSDYPFKEPTADNSKAVKAIVAWFNHSNGYETSPYYQQISNYNMAGGNPADALSIAMRFLIHYVGDAHQPLHGVSRVDAQYPNGDKGGNDFPLPNHYGAPELHAVWDKVIYEFHTNPALPFTQESWNTWGGYANDLVARHPLSSLANTQDLDPDTWHAEAFKIASTVAYKGIKENEALPQSYIDQCKDLAEKQIVTGGHRLANLLKSLALPSDKNALFLQ